MTQHPPTDAETVDVDTYPVTIVGQVNAWRSHLRWGISLPGTTLALLAYATAWTPSLLPRPWYFQGMIAALSAVFGYAIGIVIGSAVALISEWAGLRLTLNRRFLVALRRLAWAYVAITLIAWPLWSLRWQRQTARYVQMREPNGLDVLAGSAVAVAVFALFVAMWRGIVQTITWLSVKLTRRLHERVAKVTATLLVFTLIVLLINQGVVRGVLAAAAWGSDLFDSGAPAGIGQPASPLRSGSPASPVTWDSLAREGKWFVARGPSKQMIEAATGRPAKDTIRCYSSLHDLTLEQVRDRVIAEMDRTDAWSRKDILIATTTGRGNVNEWSSSAFEYLAGGDSALIAMQYSSMPSAFLLFGKQDLPERASSLLIRAVVDRVKTMPADRRPKVFLSAESLGAFGSNSAFRDAAELLATIDGAVWMGTPSFTAIHKELTDQRQGGSTEFDPVVDNGRNVRFANDAAELTADQFGRPLGPWQEPRFLYLQHRSDPVVWWGTDLLWTPPDWLLEPREGPAKVMSWYPFITFWQVTVDMAMSREVPAGFGHNYHAAQVVPAWAGVLGVDSALVPPVIAAVTRDIGP